MADLKWYVVHTYSGYEKAVADAVLKAAENRKMQDLIQDVNIPLETVTEHTDAGEKTVEVENGEDIEEQKIYYPSFKSETYYAFEKPLETEMTESEE